MNTFLGDLTTGELLFKGAAKCAAAAGGNHGTSNSSVTSVSYGTVNTDCLSSMKVCTWNMTPAKGHFEPLFSDCADWDAFTPIAHHSGVEDNAGVGGPRPYATDGSGESYFRTFRQYLGWGVLKDVVKANDMIFCSSTAGN